jgi:transposase
MAMGRDGEVQPELMVTWADIPRSPGHVFYDRLQKLLAEAGFDRFVEETCQPYYASPPPGRCFRMHSVAG